ncbi:CoA ester lyase [Agrobacterium vitis]|uniref:CoA ester lyase n=1 Tax=Agrobacterium vitis TaxID=373 RepID=A0A368NN94_AGRVI|nr:CoA ester lyase [Agrobacterium vitis]KAA3516722.1 CoA ester lyase [Agrobacterium vitis]KAA3529487.1 CoA ester lyase [Agrobacterium vitis]MCF1477530.1 CoA ester lyase [Agrobacterium vitis]MUZ97255.1 CoA ester lyase [Agrobacterium vitis]MVA28265.1 CoA ester lyase [Agrobacterium vitis]
MQINPPNRRQRFRRSLISVPAINLRALEKSLSLPCDGVIFDLEDSVAEESKTEARSNLRQFLQHADLNGREAIIRVNSSDTSWFAEDLSFVESIKPDAVLLPKAERVEDLDRLRAGAGTEPALWAMIETPKAVLAAAELAKASAALGLECLVVGLNDLRKETRVPPGLGRQYLAPWLMQVVLAARAYGLDVIDAVSNDFRDLDGFAAECSQGRSMGFDGKMLIHPAQIEAANRYFGPSEAEVAEARAIVAAFAAPEAAHLNVINRDGRMIERLHVAEAEYLLSKLSLS